jgi:hypothetical protein
MSTTVTFDAVLENDNIKIPVNYRDELITLFQGKKVRITVEPVEKPESQMPDMDNWQRTHSSFIQYLMDNPIEIDHPVRMTKDELHER